MTRWIQMLGWLILLGLAAWSDEATAQSSFQPGYVVKSSGDTLRGHILYPRWQYNPAKIRFREAGAAQEQQYRPQDLQAFEVSGDRYLGQKVEVDRSPWRVDDLTYEPRSAPKIEWLFLQVLVQGPASLFLYFDQDEREHFFVEVDGNLRELTRRRYLIERQGREYVKESSDFRGQLSYLLNRCQGVRGRILHAEYAHRSLVNLITYYNECQGLGNEFKQDVPGLTLKLAALAGISASRLEMRGDLVELFQLSHRYPTAIAPSGGLSLQVWPARGPRWLALQVELMYHHHFTEQLSESAPGSGFELSYLRGNLLLRIERPQGGWRPFALLGFSHAQALRFRFFRLMQTQPANAASARIFQVGNDARRFEHGTQVGLGLRFRQWSFSIRTESANGFSRYIGLNTTLQYRFFMLGYQF